MWSRGLPFPPSLFLVFLLFSFGFGFTRRRAVLSASVRTIFVLGSSESVFGSFRIPVGGRTLTPPVSPPPSLIFLDTRSCCSLWENTRHLFSINVIVSPNRPLNNLAIHNQEKRTYTYVEKIGCAYVVDGPERAHTFVGMKYTNTSRSNNLSVQTLRERFADLRNTYYLPF